MQLTTTKKEEKIPGFATKPWFKSFLEEYKLNLNRPARQKKKFNKIAKELGISTDWFYQVLRKDYTKEALKEVILQQGLEDTTSIYQTVKRNAKNPKHAKLYLDYFSPLTPNQIETSGGNINVFVGVFSSENKNNIEEVEVKVVKDDG